ncbi:carbonic anhydrase 1 [Calliopsis andreniformis]|uniref:carbonic anhydrase 1 n=1 Tax=Calliopsis andreniformis TaxID=337506 RepID=UPI003FCD331E
MESAETNEANIAENVNLIRKLADTEGSFETPIDLDISYMNVVELNPLKWIGVDVTPRKLKITNTGYTVILSAKWQQGRGSVTAGPFRANYVFSQAHFHWGRNAMEGSEHTIDRSRMPMELHAVYYNDQFETLESALRRDDGVTIVIYLFKLQNEPNQFIEEIVKHVIEIRAAHSSARITPMNLTSLMKPFERDYFIHWGSIITISNLHRILWLTSREPIGISVKQVNLCKRLEYRFDQAKLAEFRTLKDEEGIPILSNLRPLKDRENRHVFHVCPSGSTYASLLPLPRDFSSVKQDETSSIKKDTTEEEWFLKLQMMSKLMVKNNISLTTIYLSK